MTDLKIMIILVAKMGLLVSEMGMVLLEIEDKAEEILEVHPMVKVEDEVGLIKVQMLRHPVVSKTVDKDKMRYHYCNEIGNFIRECSKRSRDEEEA